MVNSKCHRLGVCNAAESLLVHSDVAAEFLPQDRRARRAAQALKGSNFAATSDHAKRADGQAGDRSRLRSTEYLGPIISVKVVDSLDEAIEHINRYGSQHTDAIVTGDLAAARDGSRPASTVRR